MLLFYLIVYLDQKPNATWRHLYRYDVVAGLIFQTKRDNPTRDRHHYKCSHDAHHFFSTATSDTPASNYLKNTNVSDPSKQHFHEANLHYTKETEKAGHR